MTDHLEYIEKEGIFQRAMPGMDSLAGIRCGEYTDGPARGVRFLDVYTGTGFSFTVLPDRCLDIAEAHWCGVPLSYMSMAGIRHPAYYKSSDDDEFMRVFHGGLLTTCGFSNVGGAVRVPHPMIKAKYGLHGRLSCTPAERVSYKCSWESDQYVMRITGDIMHAAMFEEKLVLCREIIAFFGESRLFIRDTIENLGYEETPFMFLYHINVGYPVFSPDSVFSCTYGKRNALVESPKNCGGFCPPLEGYYEDVYNWEEPRGNDMRAEIYNPRINLGVYTSYKHDELQHFSQWVCQGTQDYVIGMEPGMCRPENRLNAEKSGRLPVLEARGKRTSAVEIGVANR